MEKTFLSLNVSPYLILGLAIPGCLILAQDNLRLSKFHFLMPGLRCGLKGMKSTHSIRRQISFPLALARVSERANKWAQQSAWAKRAVWSKWMMEQCERMSEGPRTLRVHFIYSLPTIGWQTRARENAVIDRTRTLWHIWECGIEDAVCSNASSRVLYPMLFLGNKLFSLIYDMV